MSLAARRPGNDSVFDLECVVLGRSLALSQALIRALGLRRARPMLLHGGALEQPASKPQRPALALVLESDGAAASGVTRRLGVLWPGVCVVVVGVPNEEDAILQCVAAGVAGLVTHEESLDDLGSALHDVVENGRRLPARALAPILDRLVALSGSQSSERVAPMCRLSAREIEVTSRMARGTKNKDIACNSPSKCRR